MSDTPCPRCQDDGFLTRPGERFAEAVICRHLQHCPRCQGSGREVTRQPDGEQVLRPCGCGLLALAQRVHFYNRAQIPARFHCAKISEFRSHSESQRVTRSHFETLRHGFATGSKGVALFGSPGIGKTHLLTALAGWMTLVRGIEVRYADFSDLTVELKAGFDRGKGEAAVLAPVRTVPVLIIDELGKGRGSDWERGVIDNIISHRYNASLSTFFATNFRIDVAPGRSSPVDATYQETLKARLGPRVWSRLQAMCTLIELQGPDARAPRQPAYQNAPHQRGESGPRGAQNHRGLQRVNPRG